LRTPTAQLQVVLDARRMVRWVYVGRLAVASAILLAAVFVWSRAEAADTLAATLIFATTAAVTLASAVYSEIYRRPLVRGFLSLQTLFDLLLVTAVVHVTGGSNSQFAALYILVVACAALLLPRGGGLLIALAGSVLYFADVIVGHGTPLNGAILLQLTVFAGVAVGSGYISARLQEAGAGSRQLAVELINARLNAADILQNIRSGVMTLDARGYLLFANPAAGALLGADLEDRVGAPVLADLQRIAPGLARALSRALAAQLRTTRAEAVVDLPDRTFTIGVTTTFSKGDGTPSGMTATAIFSDISDQKRLESLHLRAERLEAVAELSASLAHEIKNPLASIRSAVEQLARMHAVRAGAGRGGGGGEAPGADEDAATLSALIVRESDRLSRLLSEFLDFARVRVTRIDRVDLGAIALEATNLAAAHPDRKEGVRVTCASPPEPLVIDGDQDLLHRAAFNLALNAVQAAPACGRVTIEVAALQPDQLPSGIAFDRGAVVLRVTDDGPGIPPDVRERLFTPFFTTKPGGTGLGLPVVHRAIEAHRGVVFVDSGAGTGGGTRFTVVLPRAQESDAEPTGRGAPPPTS
jgi:two-component system sensor histidine kinase PilS (NtrC family)